MNRIQLLTAAVALVAAGSASAAPIQLLTNGDFETGDFTGWTVTDLAGGSGSWFVSSGTSAPISSNATVGPAGGMFYAVTDQGGPGTHALAQSFLVPLGATSVIVSFDLFMNDQSGAGPLDLGLDHTGGANQHAQVDVMDAMASAFSTTPADIIATLIPPGTDGVGNPHAYTSYSFDVTGLLAAGTSYTLRFGEVDNQLFFNAGVDNVSVLADTASVPAPGSTSLLGAALLGLTLARRARS